GARLDWGVLRGFGEELPAVFRGLVRSPVRRAAQGAAPTGGAVDLRTRLAGMSAPEREDLLLELVRDNAAEILGHRSSEALDTERDFLELGFDSLATMELRNRMNKELDLRLSATAVFDHSTAKTLSLHLCTLLDKVDEKDRTAAPALSESPGNTIEQENDTVGALFRQAVARGDHRRGLDLLQAVARLRPMYSSSADSGQVPIPLSLATGPKQPQVFCFSSPMAMGGAHQYARLAASFRGVRSLTALSMPGFAEQDPLPDSADTAVEGFCAGVLRAVEAGGNDRFVLFGYSAGGLFAHATARRLEERGTPPAAVVLVDTYLADNENMDTFWGGMIGGLFEREEIFGPFTSARLSAMGWYSDLIGDLAPAPIEAPVLFVRPDRWIGQGPESTAPGQDGWRATWKDAHTVVEVAADHMTILEEQAPATAEVIESWLGSLGSSSSPEPRD
ncbi:MAG: hypothetical protein QG608_1820, partial [Actinomycetota bacterium]|nr:hypothetical protein [Actinomycetota bacterium]